MRAFALAALLIAAPAASAQASFGLKGGLNTSFFSGPTSPGLDPALGGTGGVVLRFDANPGFGIGAEALYSQKGARDEFFDETYRFDYLEVPVYGRLAVPVGEFLDGGLQFGGYVGIPLRTDVTGRNTDISANTDYGALIGFDLGSGTYYIEARYLLGFAQVSDSEEFADLLLEDRLPNEVADLQNQALSLTFGLRFGGMRRY